MLLFWVKKQQTCLKSQAALPESISPTQSSIERTLLTTEREVSVVEGITYRFNLNPLNWRLSSSEAYPPLLTHMLDSNHIQSSEHSLHLLNSRLGQSFPFPWLSSHHFSYSWNPFIKDQPSRHLLHEDPLTHGRGGSIRPQDSSNAHGQHPFVDIA